MIKIHKIPFIVATTISFAYILVGTWDNLTGLHFEKFLNDTFCNNNSCEFFLLIFYSQSYLYGALLCAFLGGSDAVFIFCQIVVIIVLSVLIYISIIIIKAMRKSIFSKK